MTHHTPPVNRAVSGTIAPLRNVALFSELLDRVVGRRRHLPGMGTFHGPSGYGKTFSATYGAHLHRALYVEVGESWTKATFCRALLTELGVPPRGTIADMVATVIAHLVDLERPLIIDEADKVVDRGYIETIREIHDRSGAAIVLIGEELLPNKLLRYERAHNRILDWVPAQPAGADDVAALAGLYTPEIEVRPDLAEHLARRSDGRVRRIVVNLERVREVAALEGLESVGLKEWGDRPLWTGQPPTRRVS